MLIKKTRSGLVGSLHYTSTLSEEEANKIKFYFNYDMIGSMNPKYAVYTDNEDHKYGAVHLYEYLKAAGKPAEYA
jgi:Zn-dependent M28 family amino/carboxypeptidase